MIRATTAMDEIRKLISQFESAVRRYDSCQPYATGTWRADWSVIANGIWKSLQNCNGGSPR